MKDSAYFEIKLSLLQMWFKNIVDVLLLFFVQRVHEVEFTLCNIRNTNVSYFRTAGFRYRQVRCKACLLSKQDISSIETEDVILPNITLHDSLSSDVGFVPK